MFLLCLVELNCPKAVLLYPKLPYVALSYPKVGMYCSKAESRVSAKVGWEEWGGWWYKPIIVSNPNFVEMC